MVPIKPGWAQSRCMHPHGSLVQRLGSHMHQQAFDSLPREKMSGFPISTSATVFREKLKDK